MTNTNILQGWRCPDCGQTEVFMVEVCGIAEVTDNSVEMQGHEWTEDSYASCEPCGYQGIVESFKRVRS